MHFTRSFLTGLLIILSFGAIAQSIIPSSSAAPSVIDTDSPVYSHLQRRILISGSGLQGSQTYFLWLKKPKEGKSSFTSASFIATTAGGVPYPDVSISLDVPPILGSYLLTVSNSSAFDSEEAKCHFGVVGTAKSVYQRTETARFVGGGALPGSSIRVDVRNPQGALVGNVTVITDEFGEFAHSWSIPNNVPVGSWTFSVDGIGTLDNSLKRLHADGQFGITEASLRMSIHQQPTNVYQRTQTAKVAFLVKYPDGSPVLTIKKDTRPVDIRHGEIRTRSLPMTLFDAMNGIWVAEYVIPKNETLGKNVTLSVSLNAFDDGFGNRAPSSPCVSSQFEVAPAQLTVSVLLTKDTYQVIFDTMTINVTVKYPDGSALVDGKVSVTFDNGGWRDQRSLQFSEKIRSWIFTYYLEISEIQHLGTWNTVILAEDNYGNRGTSSVDIRVEILWFFVTSATLAVLTLVTLKWVKEETERRGLLKKKKSDEKKPVDSTAAKTGQAP